jgi:hypothetical protein
MRLLFCLSMLEDFKNEISSDFEKNYICYYIVYKIFYCFLDYIIENYIDYTLLITILNDNLIELSERENLYQVLQN